MHFRIFDCWRLTAAVLIMSYHFLYFAPPGREIYSEFLGRLLPLLDMFFMISGFLIMGRYAGRLTTLGDYGLFLQRRVARLYPLHLATLFFFAVIAVAVSFGVVESSEPERWDLSVLPLHVLALHALGTTDGLAFNYPSWSVSAEFFCYALFPVVVATARRGGVPALLVLLGVWIAGLEIAGRHGLFGGVHWMATDRFGAYRAFADFIVGGIVALLVARRIVDVRSHGPGLLFLGFAVAAMLLTWNPYLALVGFAGAMLFTALAETARPDSTNVLKPLMPVARVSFGIYLLHPVVETLFFSLLWKRLLEPTGAIGFYVYWWLPMAVTILVAVISERVFERRFGALLAEAGRGVRARQAAAA